MAEPAGPRDVSDDALSERIYVSFEALRLPYIEGMELIPAVNSEGLIHSISVVVASQCVELTLFAAPRSGGLWAQAFDELKRHAEGRGFHAFVLTGPWGKELLLRPSEGSDDMAHRFAGIEGPGWLLRATYFGAAAEEEQARAICDSVVENILVDRGKEAKVPGEILYLTPFDELREAMEADFSEEG